jgi:ribonuclease HI
MDQREAKIRLAGQMSIFNAEAQAIIEAIKITRIIMTYSLSNIVAQKETFTKRNSKKMELKELMAEEGSNLKLMWVPAHVGIKGNETVDKAAKEALNLKVDNTYKVVKSDWSKWVKRKS